MADKTFVHSNMCGAGYLMLSESSKSNKNVSVGSLAHKI